MAKTKMNDVFIVATGYVKSAPIVQYATDGWVAWIKFCRASLRNDPCNVTLMRMDEDYPETLGYVDLHSDGTTERWVRGEGWTR